MPQQDAEPQLQFALQANRLGFWLPQGAGLMALLSLILLYQRWLPIHAPAWLLLIMLLGPGLLLLGMVQAGWRWRQCHPTQALLGPPGCWQLRLQGRHCALDRGAGWQWFQWQLHWLSPGWIALGLRPQGGGSAEYLLLCRRQFAAADYAALRRQLRIMAGPAAGAA